jgi:hypothetical protein
MDGRTILAASLICRQHPNDHASWLQIITFSWACEGFFLDCSVFVTPVRKSVLETPTMMRDEPVARAPANASGVADSPLGYAQPTSEQFLHFSEVTGGSPDHRPGRREA